MSEGTELHIGIVGGQHHRTWSEIVEQYQWADEIGLDSSWSFDHFFSLTKGDDTGGCHDGWMLLAGLASLTKNVQLGLLVTGITHRYPSVLFKQAVTLDHISHGRAILGLGAAWHEREHQAYGIPFPPPGERVDLTGEALEVFRRFEQQERVTFHGEHLQIEDAPFEPKPVNGHIPVLMGTTGKRMMRHVARYADYWDGAGTVEETVERIANLHRICEEIGRDPSEIVPAFQANRETVLDEAKLRKSFADYTAAGIRMFLLSIPTGSPSPELRHNVERVIPELREAARAGAFTANMS